MAADTHDEELARWGNCYCEMCVSRYLAERRALDALIRSGELRVQLKGPLAVACPACQSPAGERCTQPTDTTRKPVEWFHVAREDAVAS